MRTMKLRGTTKVSNGTSCEISEYFLKDRDIDLVVNRVEGRYPETGFVENLKCKEICYCFEGAGTVGLENGETFDFFPGDAFLIERGDLFYFKGNFAITMCCAPAWYKEQYKIMRHGK
jgi:mannose-6-phosphate isomerase-like protein (cupin superfamily)